MAQWRGEYRKLMNDPAERKLARQEQLIFDATELISRAMNERNVSRAELARKLGKSKSYVTQTLRGKTNLTLRTLSDFADALGYTMELGAVNKESNFRICLPHWKGPERESCYPRVSALQDAVMSLSAPLPDIDEHCLESAA